MTYLKEADITLMEYIYDTHSPQIFGILMTMGYTTTEAEQYLLKIFHKVWENINSFQKDEDHQILKIIRITFRCAGADMYVLQDVIKDFKKSNKEKEEYS